jgi:DNA (cytosine-5)-methyltransferase 1
MTAYYNENDPYAAQWLRNLIAADRIASGNVDERDIQDISADDLRGHAQCHFFAGIGGWAHALRLAGVRSDMPGVWTGSCPCQPFSAAGKGGGVADERHLWPYWFYLIEQCKPAVILGEQVASPAGLAWFDLVSSDLEGAGYAVGAADLCAAGVGAPHIRQRLWFVAHAAEQRQRTDETGSDSRERQFMARTGARSDGGYDGAAGELAHAEDKRRERWSFTGEQINAQSRRFLSAGSGAACSWSDLEWLPCTDGKARPVEPGTFPLAHGIPQRVGRLRAYGNAIVPQVAAEFISAVQ